MFNAKCQFLGQHATVVYDDQPYGTLHKAELALTNDECDFNNNLITSNYWAADAINSGFVIERECVTPMSTLILRNSNSAQYNHRFVCIICVLFCIRGF